jgi:hypothetical protein
VLLILLDFCVVFLSVVCVSCARVVVMSVTISTLKRCSVRIYPQLSVWNSCLIYVCCVCLRIVVSNAYWLFYE